MRQAKRYRGLVVIFTNPNLDLTLDLCHNSSDSTIGLRDEGLCDGTQAYGVRVVKVCFARGVVEVKEFLPKDRRNSFDERILA